MKPKITQKKLKSLFEYNDLTGCFTRIVDVAHAHKKGHIAGTIKPHGYVIIKIKGHNYLGHVLAWIYMTGEYCDKQIDHINHDRADNRWDNLREVSPTDNARNRSKDSRNKSGVVGVAWETGLKIWCAYIGHEGKTINLGRFAEFHEAVNARKNAEVLYGYHENHGEEL